jgi:multiple sugar transport system ATP-binding protein
MGRAIVRDPQVFLFDEPLSNLDAKLRVAMRAEIKELHQRLTTTTVYVTHDQIEAMTMADKIVVMNGGNVEQIGAPLELYDNPANLFVAGFIGSPAMNFLKGRVDGGAFRSDAGTALPLLGTKGLSNGSPIVYGIRPEHFQLNGGGVPARVNVIEPTGSETQVMAEFAGAPIIAAFRERVAARPGETIHISPDPAMVHLFDAQTGQRMSA